MNEMSNILDNIKSKSHSNEYRYNFPRRKKNYKTEILKLIDNYDNVLAKNYNKTPL